MKNNGTPNFLGYKHDDGYGLNIIFEEDMCNQHCYGTLFHSNSTIFECSIGASLHGDKTKELDDLWNTLENGSILDVNDRVCK